MRAGSGSRSRAAARGPRVGREPGSHAPRGGVSTPLRRSVWPLRPRVRSALATLPGPGSAPSAANAAQQDGRSMSDTVRYDDRTPRLFFLAAIFWAVVGMLVGVLA